MTRVHQQCPNPSRWPNSLCSATTLTMNPTDSTNTTTGSTLSPGDSSVYSSANVTGQPSVLRRTQGTTATHSTCGVAAPAGAGRARRAVRPRRLRLLRRARPPPSAPLHRRRAARRLRGLGRRGARGCARRGAGGWQWGRLEGRWVSRREQALLLGEQGLRRTIIDSVRGGGWSCRCITG